MKSLSKKNTCLLEPCSSTCMNIDLNMKKKMIVDNQKLIYLIEIENQNKQIQLLIFLLFYFMSLKQLYLFRAFY